MLLGAVLLAAVLTGCGQGQGEGFVPPGEGSGSYEPPPLLTNTWQDEGAVSGGGGAIDLSGVSQGYVGVRYNGPSRVKFKVTCGEEKYYYDGVSGDGRPAYFPLQMGSGAYTFTLLTQVEGTTYATALTAEANVQLESELAPFLRPSRYVDYDENSACVELFYQITQSCDTDADVVAAVYAYIRDNIAYDKERAAQESERSSGYYLPDLDQVLESKKGICFDYAALAAAMLRAGGIPTKMVFGYVSGDLYHAWNLIYLEEEGWIAVKLYVDRDTWTIIDLTFAAGSGDASVLKYIGDGSNYSQLYVY